MNDEMFHQKASKFAILLAYENPHSFFRFSFHATTLFFSCRHRPGHSLGEKLKYHERKKERKTVWVFVFQKYGKL